MQRSVKHSECFWKKNARGTCNGRSVRLIGCEWIAVGRRAADGVPLRRASTTTMARQPLSGVQSAPCAAYAWRAAY